MSLYLQPELHNNSKQDGEEKEHSNEDEEHKVHWNSQGLGFCTGYEIVLSLVFGKETCCELWKPVELTHCPWIDFVSGYWNKNELEPVR